MKNIEKYTAPINKFRATIRKPLDRWRKRQEE